MMSSNIGDDELSNGFSALYRSMNTAITPIHVKRGSNLKETYEKICPAREGGYQFGMSNDHAFGIHDGYSFSCVLKNE